MKRLICGCALVVALAGVAVTPAFAGSGGKGSQTLTATCSVLGTVTVHASNGQSAWVNNTHYVVLRFTGTFTPVTGTATTFTKVYGHKTGFTGANYMHRVSDRFDRHVLVHRDGGENADSLTRT